MEEQKGKGLLIVISHRMMTKMFYIKYPPLLPKAILERKVTGEFICGSVLIKTKDKQHSII